MRPSDSKYFYCGKTDLLGRRKRKLLIGDFKTGNSAGYEGEWYQLTGYAVALEEETGDKIEEGLIIHLDKKTSRSRASISVIKDALSSGTASCWMLRLGSSRFSTRKRPTSAR